MTPAAPLPPAQPPCPNGAARRRLPPPQRSAALLLWAATVAMLAGCAAALPPVTWVRLPAEPPAATAAAARSTEVWQLVAPVALPGHLDRDALLVPAGAAGVQPLAGVRWAEPLRDAVPRLLRHDLAAAWGVPVWATPLPPGVLPTRQLRVELLALDVAENMAGGGRGVRLHARWSVADPKGAQPPQVGEAAFDTPATGAGATDAQALAEAHRVALQRLAQRIAATR